MSDPMTRISIRGFKITEQALQALSSIAEEPGTLIVSVNGYTIVATDGVRLEDLAQGGAVFVVDESDGGTK